MEDRYGPYNLSPQGYSQDDPGYYHTFEDMANPNSPMALKPSPSHKQRSIVVLGFQNVGKSSIVGRFVNHVFRKEYNPTIASSYRKRIKYGTETLTLTIHDTTGQDKLTVFSPRHYIGVHGYILVYDVTSRHSFEIARYINEKILTVTLNDASMTPRLLVGNKSDMGTRRKVSYEEGEEMAKAMRCEFLEVSAKDNKNVEESFHTLLSSIYKSEGWNLDYYNDGASMSCGCTRLFQALVLSMLVLGAYQSGHGIGMLSDPKFTPNWWTYTRMGLGACVVGLSAFGLYASVHSRRDLLLKYAASLFLVFLINR